MGRVGRRLDLDIIAQLFEEFVDWRYSFGGVIQKHALHHKVFLRENSVEFPQCAVGVVAAQNNNFGAAH